MTVSDPVARRKQLVAEVRAAVSSTYADFQGTNGVYVTSEAIENATDFVMTMFEQAFIFDAVDILAEGIIAE